ncbi:MAG: ABC transporter permease subunit [Aestuariibacter sp.]|nr:ABC transporter permease subunit [Aestuariibacter sp.]
MDAITGWWDDYFWGSLVVVELFFVALVLTILFGLIGAGAKLSKSRIAKAIASGYTIIFRGTPEILVLLLFYFGSAITLTWIWQLFDPEVKFVDFPPFWAGSFAIALIIGSYATETFRGAFLGVDPGQIEASRALGLSNLQTFIYVRIPAMWRLALPPFGNHMLSLIKDTALVAIIGLEETLFVAEQAIGYTAKPFTMYILVGAIYLGFSTIITLTVMALEKYANRHLQVAQ